MKKITKEEAAKLIYRAGSSNAVRTAVMHLQTGEFLQVDKTDWTQKSGPGQMISRLSKKTGMEFKLTALADGVGWVVERVK